MSFLEDIRKQTESVLLAREYAAWAAEVAENGRLIEFAAPHMGYIKNRMRDAASVGGWDIIISINDIINMGGPATPGDILRGVRYSLMSEKINARLIVDPSGDYLIVNWKR